MNKTGLEMIRTCILRAAEKTTDSKFSPSAAFHSVLMPATSHSSAQSSGFHSSDLRISAAISCGVLMCDTSQKLFCCGPCGLGRGRFSCGAALLGCPLLWFKCWPLLPGGRPAFRAPLRQDRTLQAQPDQTFSKASRHTLL
mgnify:CR=1 FL=1